MLPRAGRVPRRISAPLLPATDRAGDTAGRGDLAKRNARPRQRLAVVLLGRGAFLRLHPPWGGRVLGGTARKRRLPGGGLGRPLVSARPAVHGPATGEAGNTRADRSPQTARGGPVPECGNARRRHGGVVTRSRETRAVR